MNKGKGIMGEPESNISDSHDSMIQDQVTVNISRKNILQQILSEVGATIRTEGVYKLDKSKRVAFLTVEIPPREGKNLMEVESFHRIPCMTDYEAEESVSEFAIAHFISHNNVTINDVNYGLFVEKFRQLHHCMSWSQLLQISHENLRIEKSIVLNAHMELLRHLSSICVNYSGIIPLASCAPAPQPAGICMEPVMYTGSKPPVTRHELLARELFNILQENSPNGNPIVD